MYRAVAVPGSPLVLAQYGRDTEGDVVIGVGAEQAAVLEFGEIGVHLGGVGQLPGCGPGSAAVGGFGEHGILKALAPGTGDLATQGRQQPAIPKAYGAHFAEVEVDTETGNIKVLNYVAVHDVGKAINPLALEGQIEGAMAQGLGSTLFERLEWEGGRTLNSSFLDYRMLTAQDVSPIEPILIESIDPNGPFGAKGIGEPTLVPTAAAIANAIYDAVGVRIKTLPITPDKILSALKEKESP